MELIYRVKKPETIKRFIKENYIPTSILERDEKHYKIYVNKQIQSLKDTVRKGDKIHFHIKNETLDPIEPQAFPLDVVYEDEQILIVYKPANVRMMVTKKHPKNSLANALIHYYKKHNIQAKLHFINRVDPDVSGLVVLAKHKFIRFLLSDKVHNEVTFNYQAIVSGHLQVKDFSICLPVSKIENSNLRQVSETGKDCETNYHVIKEFKNFSLIDIRVKNKVTHQIKVHMAHFDNPIVGDKYYNEDNHNVDRILLDGYKVSFRHPITEEDMVIQHQIAKAITDFM